jgi:hypothetical protein
MAARFANRLASASVTLEGVSSIGRMVVDLEGERQAIE